MNSSYCWLDVRIQYDIETVPLALKLFTKKSNYLIKYSLLVETFHKTVLHTLKTQSVIPAPSDSQSQLVHWQDLYTSSPNNLLLLDNEQ